MRVLASCEICLGTMLFLSAQYIIAADEHATSPAEASPTGAEQAVAPSHVSESIERELDTLAEQLGRHAEQLQLFSANPWAMEPKVREGQQRALVQFQAYLNLLGQKADQLPKDVGEDNPKVVQLRDQISEAHRALLLKKTEYEQELQRQLGADRTAERERTGQPFHAPEARMHPLPPENADSSGATVEGLRRELQELMEKLGEHVKKLHQEARKGAEEFAKTMEPEVRERQEQAAKQLYAYLTLMQKKANELQKGDTVEKFRDGLEMGINELRRLQREFEVSFIAADGNEYHLRDVVPPAEEYRVRRKSRADRPAMEQADRMPDAVLDALQLKEAAYALMRKQLGPNHPTMKQLRDEIEQLHRTEEHHVRRKPDSNGPAGRSGAGQQFDAHLIQIFSQEREFERQVEQLERAAKMLSESGLNNEARILAERREQLQHALQELQMERALVDVRQRELEARRAHARAEAERRHEQVTPAPAPGGPSAQGDIRDALQEMRQEIRGLRRDINELRETLEKKNRRAEVGSTDRIEKYRIRRTDSGKPVDSGPNWDLPQGGETRLRLGSLELGPVEIVIDADDTSSASPRFLQPTIPPMIGIRAVGPGALILQAAPHPDGDPKRRKAE